MKKKQILFYILITILFFASMCNFCFNMEFTYYDESWNFYHIQELVSGMSIYKDVHIIITPLFFIISKLFLKLFSVTIFNFRILNLILSSITYILIFCILKKLVKSKHMAILYSVLIISFSHGLVTGGANYNILAWIFVLSGILLFLLKKDSKYYHYLQGLIVFFTFFSKQNIGALYGIGLLVYEIIFNRKNYFVNNFKKFITFSIPLVLSLCLMNNQGILWDFINYCFLGIGDFTNNFIVDSSSLTMLIFVINIFLYIIIKKYAKEFDFTNLNFLMVMNAFAILCVLPICNTYHNHLVGTFSYIVLFYILDEILLNDILSEHIKILNLLIIGLLIAIFIKGYVWQNLLTDVTYLSDSKIYANVPLSEENYNAILNLGKLIENNNVMIYSSDAFLACINEEYFGQELAFRGNFGKNGEEKELEKIKNASSDTLFLIKTSSEELHFQESRAIYNYIKDNLNKELEILDFSIYRK